MDKRVLHFVCCTLLGTDCHVTGVTDYWLPYGLGVRYHAPRNFRALSGQPSKSADIDWTRGGSDNTFEFRIPAVAQPHERDQLLMEVGDVWHRCEPGPQGTPPFPVRMIECSACQRTDVWPRSLGLESSGADSERGSLVLGVGLRPQRRGRPNRCRATVLPPSAVSHRTCTHCSANTVKCETT